MEQRAVDTAIRILDQLAEAPAGLTLVELSSDQRVSSATMSRIVKSLAAAGLVVQNEHKRYTAGLKLWGLGVSALARQQYRPMAALEGMRLAAQTSLAVFMAFPEDDRIVIVERYIPVDETVLCTPAYSPRLLHETATGKAVLATRYPTESGLRANLKRLLPAELPAGVTQETILAEVMEAQRNGYAMNRGEFGTPGGTVAAAAIDYTGQPKFALGVEIGFVPPKQIEQADDLYDRIVAPLLRCVHTISTKLGRSQDLS